jgi:hypothetical protein
MSSISSNHTDPDQRPPVQLKVPNLTHRNLKPAPNLSNERADKTALLLERMHIPKKKINLKDPSKHGLPPLARVVAKRWWPQVSDQAARTAGGEGWF